MRTLAFASIITLIFDQITKFGVVQFLNLKELGRLDVLPPLVNFRMAWNRGVNFGLFASDEGTARWILIAVSLLAVGFILWWVRRDRMGGLAQVFAGLLIGGALGNALDRVIYGAVADFLNVTCCGYVNPWSFNVADIAIFVGAFGLVLFSGNKPESESSNAA